jgi:hypothetical protein
VATALTWINENREWLFSGIGGAIVVAAWTFLVRRKRTTAGTQQSLRSGDTSRNIQVGRDLTIVGMDRAPAAASILEDLDRSMGDLFAVLRNDLKQHPFVCEFFALPSKHILLGMISEPRFRFNADEIPDLFGKLHVLEGHGFLRDVTPSTAKIYRMSEDFVKYLVAPR